MSKWVLFLVDKCLPFIKMRALAQTTTELLMLKQTVLVPSPVSRYIYNFSTDSQFENPSLDKQIETLLPSLNELSH